MLKKIVVLTLVALFAVGVFSAMAGEGGSCGQMSAYSEKNPLRGAYDWFSGWGKK